jgi:hypothetical protein
MRLASVIDQTACRRAGYPAALLHDDPPAILNLQALTQEPVNDYETAKILD